MIEFENISLSYGDRLILNNINILLLLIFPLIKNNINSI